MKIIITQGQKNKEYLWEVKEKHDDFWALWATWLTVKEAETRFEKFFDCQLSSLCFEGRIRQ